MHRVARVRKSCSVPSSKDSQTKRYKCAKAVFSGSKLTSKSRKTTSVRRSRRERKPTQRLNIAPEPKKTRQRRDPTEKNVSLCSACGEKGLLLCCESCPKAFHLKCVQPALDALPEGTWFCDECHDQYHDDACDVCGFGGDLLCCDRCSLVYHVECVGLTKPPEGRWECSRCRTPMYTPLEGPDNMPKLRQRMMQYGLCRMQEALTPRQVKSVRNYTMQCLHKAFDTVRRLGLQQELIDVGFQTFKTRSFNRYDLRIPEFMTAKFPFLNKKAKWIPLVNAILGDDCRVVHSGVMLSLPGSANQPYHMDGPHLNQKKHLPPHCINVFLPLVDLTPAIGPTQFVPTSHILHNFWDSGVKPTILEAKCGQCILFDYRIRHRGIGNKTQEKRPVVYITYAKKSFRDTKNFSKSRYRKLPELGRT